MEVQLLLRVSLTVVLVGVFNLLFGLCNALILKPRRLGSILEKQGIKGPPPTFFLGNLLGISKAISTLSKPLPAGEKEIIHNCGALIVPFFQQWTKEFGRTFMFSIGNMPFLHINDPDVVKQLCLCTSSDFGKTSFQMKLFHPLAGDGVANSNGALWSQQRKIMAPEFFNKTVKGMTKMMVDSATTVVYLLADQIEREGGVADINVEYHTTKFARDIISRLCFGSNHSLGEEIFSKFRDLLHLSSTKANIINALFPILRYVPTNRNRESWRLEKEIKASILKLVKEREQEGTEKDILQLIVEGAKNYGLDEAAADRFVTDNCKNIYMAGFETISSTAMWTLMLLAINPEWQARVRQEVLEIRQGQVLPDADMIQKMKMLKMVIYESMRLYATGPFLTREALEDLKFGDIYVPKGVNVVSSIVTMNYDPEIWGPDAHTFNPERFSNGVSGSCTHPHVYMPFGTGPRICLGQHLAMAELNILLSLFLSNFSFSLSPNYRHSPVVKVAVEPEYGLNLILRKL
jgi:cytochrome P450